MRALAASLLRNSLNFVEYDHKEFSKQFVITGRSGLQMKVRIAWIGASELKRPLEAHGGPPRLRVLGGLSAVTGCVGNPGILFSGQSHEGSKHPDVGQVHCVQGHVAGSLARISLTHSARLLRPGLVVAIRWPQVHLRSS